MCIVYDDLCISELNRAEKIIMISIFLLRILTRNLDSLKLGHKKLYYVYVMFSIKKQLFE